MARRWLALKYLGPEVRRALEQDPFEYFSKGVFIPPFSPSMPWNTSKKPS